MRRIFRILLVMLNVMLLILLVMSFAAYKRIIPYTNNQIDDAVIEGHMQSGESKLYYFDHADRTYASKKVESKLYCEIHGAQKYERVSIDEVPQHLKDAFISIEDRNFYRHNGVDLIRTARASMNYIFKRHSSFGASTITQQLVKNLTGLDEISARRKINEIFCALDLESRYTKDEILEMYLNIINLGNGCRGVRSAARYYFSLNLQDLDLAQCACIAAITNNPTYYDPIKMAENNKKRRDIILKCMYDEGYIDNESLNAALSEEIVLNISDTDTEGVNSWYTDMVIDDVINALCEKYKISRSAASDMLYMGGLKIYTAVDTDIQRIVEGYYGDTGNFKNADTGLASAFIIIDQKTGDILGVAGNIGKKEKDRIQNFATDTKRPSGSAIKPLSVYAPALERGIISWSSIYEDSPVISENTPWPRNASGTYVGNVDIAYAVKHSLNTVPVKILNQLGVNESLRFLKEKLGFASLHHATDTAVFDECPASLALGQHENGVTLRELTAAYTIFDAGEYKRPRSYYKVTDHNGNILLDSSDDGEYVISPENAAIMTKLLEGVVNDGTARGAIGLDDRVSVAGKTGTTTGTYDRYFIGYTPSLLAGAWMGYEYPKSMYGKNPTLSIWNDIMSRIYEMSEYENESKSFHIPSSVHKLSYDKTTGDAPDQYSTKQNIENGWFCE